MSHDTDLTTVSHCQMHTCFLISDFIDPEDTLQ